MSQTDDTTLPLHFVDVPHLKEAYRETYRGRRNDRTERHRPAGMSFFSQAGAHALNKLKDLFKQ